MKPAPSLASSCLAFLAATPAAFAQGSLEVVVPDAWATTQAASNNNWPFNFPNSGVGRYQQVYAAADFAGAGVSFPIQITELAFRPGQATPAGSYQLPGRDLTLTIALSETAAGPDLLSTTFASNPSTTPATVYAGTLTLPTVAAFPGPGPHPWSWFVPLQTPFFYDGSADLLLEVAVTGLVITGPSGSAPLDAVNTAGDPVSRIFHNSNPSAVTGFSDSLGLITRFSYDAGGFSTFGSGCPGSGGFVPAIGSVGGPPMLGNLGFAVTLSGAPGGSPGSFVLGASTTSWIGIPLPWELLPFGAPGCFLLASADVIVPITTSGAGPGAGTSALGIPIPPIPSLAGASAHMQWVILDLALGHPVVSDGATATLF